MNKAAAWFREGTSHSRVPIKTPFRSEAAAAKFHASSATGYGVGMNFTRLPPSAAYRPVRSEVLARQPSAAAQISWNSRRLSAFSSNAAT